jgi:conjugative relaxase-like TrwC/TraI family protein
VLGLRRIGSERALYYLSDLARELPLPFAPAPGTWAGAAAGAMGLEGPVEPAAFQALLQGRHPRTGRRLGSGRASAAGLDLTFSAPKSVSVLFALAGDDVARRVAAAHADAVSGALAYLERHALGTRRRTGGERAVLPTSGVVAGRFTHGVNRNHDPHLHTHVVMVNLVHGSDGRWGASDGRGLGAHAGATSALYEAHLRHELCRGLGVRWTVTSGKGTEIDGIPPALLGEFSSRAAEIRRHQHETGARSARGGRIAWAVTRAAKEPAPPYDVLASDWRQRADSVDRAEHIAAGRPTRPGPGRTSVDEHAFAAVLEPLPHRGAYRRDVVQAFATAAPDGAPAPWVEELTAAWVPKPATIAVGVAEPLHRRVDVMPGGHLVEALGPRPLDPRAHELWREAGRAIDGYRERWGLTRARDAFGLGDPPLPPAALGAARLADHVRTRCVVDTVRTRLGRHERPAVELSLER